MILVVAGSQTAARAAAALDRGNGLWYAANLAGVWLAASSIAVAVYRTLVRGPTHDPVDLFGRLMVVTGANTGVGFDTARGLAALGAEVVLACRSPQKAAVALARIRAEVKGARVWAVELDLSSLASVRECAAELVALGRPVDALINNAGVMPAVAAKTIDDLDIGFQCNHLGHFLLTNLLAGSLRKARSGGRVVNLGSAIHHIPTSIDLPEVAARELVPFPGMFPAYADTKLCNLLFTAEFNRRFRDVSAVQAFCVHPGTVISSEVARHLPPLVRRLQQLFLPFMWPLMKSGAAGAHSSIAAATTLQIVADAAYVVNCRLAVPNPLGTDPSLGAELWALSERLCGESFAAPARRG